MILKNRILNPFLTSISNVRYTDVCARILKIIEEKPEISVQDLCDECVRMETIMSDTTMIQNRTEEYGNARKSKTKNIP